MKHLLCALLLTTLFAHSQQRPAITGIAFVRVYAQNPADSQAFYGDVIGLDSTTTSGITRYAVNDLQWVELVPMPNPAPHSRQAAVGLMTRDVSAMEHYLRAKHVAIVDPLRHGSFSVHDPEGHLIIFVQPDAAHLPSAATISPHAAAHRIIHAGFVVHDATVEQHFFGEILGFQPNWHGGRTDSTTDWVSLHVPDGTDWIEFMLNVPGDAPQKQLGGANHFSMGVEKISTVIDALQRNGCKGKECTIENTHDGRDGKIQLNLFDPDMSRVEFMEFKPSTTTCCSRILGKAPTEVEDR
jgi:catechol 2,3-dioxygenase-like lactoylglutathione lyase family enzyme